MLMAEFATACRYGLPIKVVINNNASLGQIMWEQLVLGYPEFGIRSRSRSSITPRSLRRNGAFGVKVARPGELPAALREAFGHDGPALVDVNVNPEEPPLPGKVEYEQAKKFAEAFLHGQPRKATIATTLFKDKIQQLRS